MIARVAKATFEATFYWALGIAACLLQYRIDGRNTEFACRWNGECAGWTRVLAAQDAIGNLIYWWAYCGISTAVLRFHPVMQDMALARWTVRLTWAFVITCGVTHLIAAYLNINPVYEFAAAWVSFTGPISAVAFFFVSYGLIRTFVRVKKNRERLAQLEARQKR
jgi:hypothetical protein